MATRSTSSSAIAANVAIINEKGLSVVISPNALSLLDNRVR
jgi:hypothetical protein